MAKSSDKYATVLFTTSKSVKAANIAYEKAYGIMRELDTERRRLKALEMAHAGLIPQGTWPVFKSRPWDGVLQVELDADGQYLTEAPRTEKGKKAEQRTV